MVQKAKFDAHDSVIGNLAPAFCDDDAFDLHFNQDAQFDGAGSTADGDITGNAWNSTRVDPNDYEDYLDNFDAFADVVGPPCLTDLG